MFKDLPASLVAAVSQINQKSREAYVAEQKAIEIKKDLKAKHSSMMPKQPTPKADPAAVSNAHKMAEAVEGSIPKTPREKELAAKHGHPKRITFGDVLKARGVKMKEEVESVDEGMMDKVKKIGKKVIDTITHKDDDELLADYRKKVNPASATKPAKPKSPMAHSYVKEGKMAELDMDLKDLSDKDFKETYGKPKSAFKPEKKETAAHEKAEKKKMKMESWEAMMSKVKADSEKEKKEKGTGKFDVKKTSTGTVYTRKSSTFTNGTEDKPKVKNEEVESVTVKHEQYGTGKTLPQFAEDLSWMDVMFDEGIKRVDVEDLELVEAAAVHPKAIHVSDAGGGKYKVHAVGKEFAHGIKVGEHLTDTHLDDFSEMGGKIKMVKAPKKD